MPEVLSGIRAKLEEDLFDQPPAEGVPQVKLQRGAGGTQYFANLQKMYQQNGPVFKSTLGPAGILCVADPTMVRHIFAGRGRYDKGPLAIVSGDIFGKGLITASERDVWQDRRKVVSQGFHSKWLRGLVEQFASCTEASFRTLDDRARFREPVDMESVYLNLTLDVVGLTVFGVDFNAAEQPPDSPQSPVVRAVYRVLKETSYRTENPLQLLLKEVPGGLGEVLPEVAEFRASLGKLDAVLDEAIAEAQRGQVQADVDSLQAREGGTLLRFLVDLRGESVESAQLRDDLRTLIIAGHETVASVLTWATFELTRNPDVLAKVMKELESVLGGRTPTYEDVRSLKYLRLVIAETLRMYPAPPNLFRRTLAPDTLPKGAAEADVPIGRGTLILLLVTLLHRNPRIYEQPDRFWPERWLEPFGGEDSIPGWRGYDPSRVTGLYPSEVAADYAFIPFSGGEYKCIGDQFAMLEVTVVLAMILQKYRLEPLQKGLDDVGTDIAATIHTKNGLRMRVEHREC